jgi:hypothetical protein
MENESTNPHLAGYCGLYCGACDILRLYVDGQKDGRTPAWTDLPEPFRRHLPIGSGDVRCHGCGSDDVFAGCSRCPVRACAKRKGTVEFCTQCESYPCWRTRLFQVFAWLFSVEKKLPHQKTKQPNLARVACVGRTPWLLEQQARWRCPDCGAAYSWYATACASCHRELGSLKSFASGG